MSAGVWISAQCSEFSDSRLRALTGTAQVTVDRFEHNACGPKIKDGNELLKWQAVYFTGGLTVKTLALRIDGVEKGSKYDDSCMSQLQFFPYRANSPT